MSRLLQVLGPGCYKCSKLAESAERAAKELGLDYRLEKVTYIAEMMKFGVMMTPALVVDGSVKVVGQVPSVAELKTLLG
ncbi:MAG: TM0996/MTH895 family glutaredoxin-like protein [Candidatus Riflebacteria bacterium]|nr:TM0996/MTH895 family glutaredoxin-like protein [Candidatus Riflebacteria bacterium]